MQFGQTNRSPVGVDSTTAQMPPRAFISRCCSKVTLWVRLRCRRRS